MMDRLLDGFIAVAKVAFWIALVLVALYLIGGDQAGCMWTETCR